MFSRISFVKTDESLEESDTDTENTAENEQEGKDALAELFGEKTFLDKKRDQFQRDKDSAEEVIDPEGFKRKLETQIGSVIQSNLICLKRTK